LVKKKGKEKSAALEILVGIERPKDDFQETLYILQEASLTHVFSVVSLPPIIVTKEKCPFPSLIFTPSKRTWFHRRPLYFSWHSITCNQLKSKKWPMEEGQISCIMKELISVNTYIFEFVSSPFVSMTHSLKI